MKDKPVEARKVIVAKLEQMLRLKVWHREYNSSLSAAARKAIKWTSSSPTAATSSVMDVTAIAAVEHRRVMTIDVGGAFLNADITTTGILVHLRLDLVMTRCWSR